MDFSKVVTVGPSKEAALYFDRVLPIDFGESLLPMGKNDPDTKNYIPFTRSSFDKEVVNSLLGEDIGIDTYLKIVNFGIMNKSAILLQTPEGREAYRKHDILGTPTLSWLENSTGFHLKEIWASIEAGTFNYDDFRQRISSNVTETVKKIGFDDCPIWASHRVLSHPLKKGKGSEFFLSLSGLKLVDPSKVEWEKIIEFRKDKNSRSALRDFRIFFQTQYDGKDPAFIYDDLQSRIDQHDNIVKLWGFETVQRSLSTLFSEKTAIASSAASIATHTIGGTLLTAAGAGAVIALGGIAIEFGKLAIDHKKQMLDRPVRYLANLRDELARPR